MKNCPVLHLSFCNATVPKHYRMKRTFTLLIAVCYLICADAQNSKPTYPSLLWEITGNGLTQPSYLFGTMHVSNKMVFHLSDSFYHAIASCSTVSLELDPRQWQSEMFRLQQSQMAMSMYLRAPADLLRETSFRLNSNYDVNIKNALSEEPYVINGLLYRTMDGQSNFQENTYLDLYVYQTARKLGKNATGVENYLESEKIQLEAQEDMLRARTRARVNFSNDNPYEIQRKIQEAYRRGDLGTLDSLTQLSGNNEAFNEKFLYGRNEIQANSIDSIIRSESLFVAVGAAHLPGPRGVIEMLRKKGYTLRPVNMNDRDAEQREHIDKIRVPVQMQNVLSEDGFIALKVPGKLFRRNDVLSFTESWQYADMDNGAYYMLSRIKTHPGQTGETLQSVMHKTDSVLYESIPGKILEKKNITVSGYQGLSITNKTRRGDIQRYSIIYTPQEVLVFKMSGTDDYVNGKEAEDFFGSIHLQQQAATGWNAFTPAGGGFTISMPQLPATDHYLGEDLLGSHIYEATDPSNGDAYMVMQKSLHNYRFLEEDSFDVSLIAESLKSSGIIEKEVSRKAGKQDGLYSLDIQYSLKDGGTLKARAFIKGAQYYLLTARSRNSKAVFSRFFNSFHTTPFSYSAPVMYTDMSLGFSVMTPVQPAIDQDLKDFLNKQQFGTLSILLNERYLPRPIPRSACFKSDSTGEAIQVIVSEFPKYYHSKDTADFWNTEMNWEKLKDNFIIDSRNYHTSADSSLICEYVLSDTNTDRRIRGMAIVYGNRMYKLQTIMDSHAGESSFVKDFFSSFRPLKNSAAAGVFTSKSTALFNDMVSSDSAVQKIARSAINMVNLEGNDIDALKSTFRSLTYGSRDYLLSKTGLIQSAASIKDTIQQQERLAWLASVYHDYADTGMYQNAALRAIASIKTKAAYDTLKKILADNPPVFDNTYEYAVLFREIDDSLALAAHLYPDILSLVAFDDYKQPMIQLLAKLVDSNYVQADTYKSQFPKFFFDLQVQAKKLQAQNERELLRSQTDNDRMENYTGNAIPGNIFNTPINQYLVLLMPFYDENPQVAKIFDRLLQGKDIAVRMNIALLMVRHKKPVPDSIWRSIAADDQYRVSLYEKLEKSGNLSLFPSSFKTQEAISRSLATSNNRSYTRITEIQPMGKQWVQVKNNSGYVYFFKYRIQKQQDDWLMAVSGIQPSDTTQVSLNRSLLNYGNRKLLTNSVEQEQYEKLTRQLVMEKRPSAAGFFERGRRGFGEIN